jgi:hypothetical protein
VASLLITTLPTTPIIYNRISSLIIMTAFLCKSKAVLLELMRSMPDAHIVKKEDFVAWGRQFVDIMVSRK